jgi:hypothetical protein
MMIDQQVDDDAFETVIGRDGRPVKILRDKTTTRIRMSMRDANTVAGQIAASKQHVHDGTDYPYALNRPGSRFSDGVNHDAAREAYEQATRDSEAAWRGGPGNSNYGYTPAPGLKVGEFLGAREGDVCMTDDTHEPGQLVRGDDGRLTCRPTARRDSAPVLDWRGAGDLGRLIEDSERIKSEARAAADREASEAWRNLRSA